MQSFVAAVLLAASALATPFSCPGGVTNSSPMCCSTNLLGVLALDCEAPGTNGCSAGMKPNCCTLEVAKQGLLCNSLR